MTKYLGLNWRTNLIGLISAIMSAEQVIRALQAWAQGQPMDWRGAILAAVIAVTSFLAKDSAVHSTSQEVKAADVEKKG